MMNDEFNDHWCWHTAAAADAEEQPGFALWDAAPEVESNGSGFINEDLSKHMTLLMIFHITFRIRFIFQEMMFFHVNDFEKG